MNQTSEYWYMGSIFAKSLIQKYKTDECSATGKYPWRVVSISTWVFSATSCLAEISSELQVNISSYYLRVIFFI